MVGIMLYIVGPERFDLATSAALKVHPVGYSNVKEIGAVLYTEYFYPFELAAILLCVAIISAISLAFRGRQMDSRAQKISKQHLVNAKDRIYFTKNGR